MLGQVSALFSCLSSVIDASLPMRTVWEIDKAFRIHLLSLLFFINVGDLSALLTKLHAWHIMVKWLSMFRGVAETCRQWQEESFWKIAEENGNWCKVRETDKSLHLCFIPFYQEKGKTKCALSQCCNLQEEVACKSEGGKGVSHFILLKGN